MRSRFAALVLGILLAGALLAVQRFWTFSRRDASGILLESAKRSHSMAYTGVVQTSALYYGKEINSIVKIYHKGCDHRMEYMSKPMAGMIVVGDEDLTYTYHPKAARMLVSEVGARPLEQRKVRLLLKNYDARVSGSDTIAGRPAYVVDITPKNYGNPSKRLWIDEKTYVVIGQEDVSATGTVKSRMSFKEINYGSNISPEKFVVPIGPMGHFSVVQTNEPMSPEKLTKALGFRVTAPTYVPKGYELADYQLYHCQCKCDHNSAHIRYSDGLNSISIFETSIKVDCVKTMCGGEHHGTRPRMGNGEDCKVGDCRQAHIGHILRGDKSVVVVADLPHTDIERIAKSIK